MSAAESTRAALLANVAALSDAINATHPEDMDDGLRGLASLRAITDWLRDFNAARQDERDDMDAHVAADGLMEMWKEAAR